MNNQLTELTAGELDTVTGGNAFWGAVFGFAMDNTLGAYVKNSGAGYGDIMKEVMDAAGKKGGGTPK